jgi:predicted GTPase
MGPATDAAGTAPGDSRVVKPLVVAVSEPLPAPRPGPTAARIRELRPDAGVVRYADGLPRIPPADVVVVVVDPLLALLPPNLADADIVVVDDALEAPRDTVAAALAAIEEANPRAIVIRATSAPRLAPGPSLMDTAVLVVEDGASVTDGHTAAGPGTLAAVDAEVGMRVDPRPFAVGSLVETYHSRPQLGSVLPVMAYDEARLAEVEATIAAVECDAVIDASAIDLSEAIEIRRPVRRVVRDLREVTAPTLAEALRLSTHGDSVSPPMPAAATRRKLAAGKQGGQS